MYRRPGNKVQRHQIDTVSNQYSTYRSVPYVDAGTNAYSVPGRLLGAYYERGVDIFRSLISLNLTWMCTNQPVKVQHSWIAHSDALIYLYPSFVVYVFKTSAPRYNWPINQVLPPRIFQYSMQHWQCDLIHLRKLCCVGLSCIVTVGQRYRRDTTAIFSTWSIRAWFQPLGSVHGSLSVI